VVEPQYFLLHNFKTDLVPFESIDHYPCLILLGEPGMGKSAEISEMKGCIIRNLNVCSSEYMLFNYIFNTNEFKDWITGINTQSLVLDSLDECKIPIPSISQIILNQLQRQEGICKQHLKLRIICRTADWPESLENGLIDLFGKDGVGIFELAPLCRCDVEEAIRSEGIDEQLFMDEIDKMQASSLAIKPITLKFLINVFKRDKKLLSPQAELYRRGCEILCEDPSPSRREKRGPYIGKLTSSQRLILAARIAAVMMFCKKTAIFTSIDIGQVNENEIKINDLCTGYEKVNGVKLEVTRENIDETLKYTSLFSGRGLNRLGFSHQTYDEFLAAYYIKINNMDKEQIMSLIQHSIGNERKIIPQLSNTAAWIASMNKDIFKDIINIDPQVILKSDISSYSNDIKQEWVSSLLNMMEDRRITDSDWSLGKYYSKMNHPRLAEQLIPYISDPSKYFITRRSAINIAEACNLNCLQNLLADIVLNESEDYHIRSQAAHAVKEIGDNECKLRLKPLAIGNNPSDTDDELKGYALIALWPNQISAEEVFDNLSYPKKPNYCGSYWSFQYIDLLDLMRKDDLPIALKWVHQQTINKSDEYELNSILNHLIYVGWQNTDNQQILDALIDVIIVCIENHLGIYGEHKRDYENQEVKLPPDEIRHRVIEKVVPRVIGIKDWEWQLTRTSIGDSLILMDDMPWLIEVLKNEKDEKLKFSWSKIIYTMVYYNRDVFDKYFDDVYNAAQSCLELQKEIEVFCKAVPIDSQQYINGKEQYEKMKNMIESRETKTKIAPLNERLNSCLDSFENGNIDAWCNLCNQMLFSDQKKHYRNVFELDITSLQSWISVDSKTKCRIINSAQVYIMKQVPEINRWISEDKIHPPDHDGYKALFLLFKEKPDFIKTMNNELWEKWAPVILACPEYYGSEKKEPHLELISLAYQNAPKPVINTLLILIEKDNKSSQYLSCFYKVKKCWDENLCNSLLLISKNDSLKPVNQGQLLGELIKNGSIEAYKYAESLLSLPLSQNKEKRDRSLYSAIALIKNSDDAGWNVVWPLIKRNASFGKKIISIIVNSLDHPYERSFITKLNENQIADLYIWLEQKYPYSEDQHILENHTFSTREQISHFKRSVINYLTERGTIGSIKAIERIMKKLPHLDFIKNILIQAKRKTIQEIWIPSNINQFLRFVQYPGSRIIENGEHLLEAVISSIEKLEDKFHGDDPSVEEVWNESSGNVFRPKDEISFSSYITRYLNYNLKETAIFVKPEVQIRRGIGKGPNKIKGQRTDIYIEAAILGIEHDKYEKVKLIIEVKGCWNPKIMNDMKAQLVERYLKNNDCQYGLYLVGWFNCPQWDLSDPRMKQCKKWKLKCLKKKLEEQSKSLSNQERTIRSHIIDCSLSF